MAIIANNYRFVPECPRYVQMHVNVLNTTGKDEAKYSESPHLDHSFIPNGIISIDGLDWFKKIKMWFLPSQTIWILQARLSLNIWMEFQSGIPHLDQGSSWRPGHWLCIESKQTKSSGFYIDRYKLSSQVFDFLIGWKGQNVFYVTEFPPWSGLPKLPISLSS